MAKKKPRTVPVGRNKIKHAPPRPVKRTTRKVTPKRPPAGSYDVDLDAQERAAKRGFGYSEADTRTARTRNLEDLTIGQGDVQRQHDEVGRQYGESLADLLTARTQGQQDYTTNLQTIARNFQQLGNQQAQRGRQAGLTGGFAAQAARKRAGNEAIERAPVDLSFQRFLTGSQLAEKRLGEARDRGFADTDRAGGALNLNYTRGDEDLTTASDRSGRDLQSYLLDLSAARQQQAGTPLGTQTVKNPLTVTQKAQQQRYNAYQAARKATTRARRKARGRI